MLIPRSSLIAKTATNWAGTPLLGVTTILAPGTNVRGVLVHLIVAYVLNEGVKVFAVSAAPVNIDVNQRSLLYVRSTGVELGSLVGPLLVAPGLGLYAASVASSGNARLSIDYEVL